MIRVQCLGTIALTRADGTAIRSVLAQPKRFALLAYLAAPPLEAHSRDTLVGLLWPELDETRARRALRQSLHGLRGALGDGVLTGKGRELVGVDPERMESDAVAFRVAVEEGRDRDALELYRGPFLEGFHVSGVPEFERWTHRKRRDFRLSAVEAALRSADQAADGRAARRWADRALDLAPYDGGVLRRYVTLMRRIGQPATALRAFEAYRERMSEDLGLEPSDETVALMEEFGNGPSDTRAVGLAPPSTSRRVPATGEGSRTIWTREERRDAPDRSENTEDGQGFDPDGTGATSDGGAREAVPAPPASVRRGTSGGPVGRLFWWTAAVGVLGLVASLLIAVGPMGHGSEPQSLVLADFQDLTADSLLGPAVTEAVRIDLSRSAAVRLSPPAAVRAVLERMERDPEPELTPELAREIAVREGMSGVLEGAVHSVGEGYLLSARVIDPHSREVRVAVRELAEDREHLIRAVDRLARRFREEVGESVLSLQGHRPLPEVTTASLAALERYASGVRTLRREMDYRRGVEHLAGAVRHDSTFAMAWRQLGIARMNFGGSDAEMREALTAAHAFRDRLTELERHLTVGTYQLNVAGNRQRAAAAFRRALELDPDNVVALGNLGALNLWHLRDYRAAERYMNRLGEISGDAYPRRHLGVARAVFAQGRTAEAESSLLRLKGLTEQSEGPSYPLLRFDLSTRDYETASAKLEEARKTWRDDLHVRRSTDLLLGFVARVQGRIGDARRHFHDAAEAAWALGRGDQFLEASLELGATYAGTPEGNERGVAVLDGAFDREGDVSRAGGDRPNRRLASFYAEMGRPDRARSLLAEEEDSASPDAFKEWPLAAPLGYMALAEGRTEDARHLFRRAHLNGQEPIFFLAPLGRAYHASGREDSAAAVFERFLTTPWLGGYRYRADARYLPDVLETLARLYENQGDIHAALPCYRSFVRLWENADPALQPRVQRARERISSLDEGLRRSEEISGTVSQQSQPRENGTERGCVGVLST